MQLRGMLWLGATHKATVNLRLNWDGSISKFTLVVAGRIHFFTWVLNWGPQFRRVYWLRASLDCLPKGHLHGQLIKQQLALLKQVSERTNGSHRGDVPLLLPYSIPSKQVTSSSPYTQGGDYINAWIPHVSTSTSLGFTRTSETMILPLTLLQGALIGRQWQNRKWSLGGVRGRLAKANHLEVGTLSDERENGHKCSPITIT